MVHAAKEVIYPSYQDHPLMAIMPNSVPWSIRIDGYSYSSVYIYIYIHIYT